MLFTGVIAEGDVQGCHWQGPVRVEIDMKYPEPAECGDVQGQGSNTHSMIKYQDSLECFPSRHICASKCSKSVLVSANKYYLKGFLL